MCLPNLAAAAISREWPPLAADGLPTIRIPEGLRGSTSGLRGTETSTIGTTGTAMRIVCWTTIFALLQVALPLGAQAQQRMLRLPPTNHRSPQVAGRWPESGRSQQLSPRATSGAPHPSRDIEAARHANRAFSRLPAATPYQYANQPNLNPPESVASPALVPGPPASVQPPSGLRGHPLPVVTSAWWEQYITQTQRPGAKLTQVRAEELVASALMHSQHVLALSEGPRIREQGILKAVADFDPAVFFETRWDDQSNPVGNVLTTGGPTRFLDQQWQGKAGMRQKTWLGGTVEWSQHLGLQDTNSLFFLPKDQAATRMALSFSQPLLKRGGREYNESLILIAEIQTDVAQHELARELQDHAYEVIQAYWELYLQRALALQRQRAHQQAIDIMLELQSRRELDSLRSQIARARAAVAVRRAALRRAELGVQTAQARIVALTNDPAWQHQPGLELTPGEAPAAAAESQVNLPTAFQNALHFRPEIAETMGRVREAQLRLGMSKNELLPTLNLVVDTYVAGLDGEYDVSQSFRSQFNEGAPSYGAGLVFQMPLGNRAAKAELVRRDRELSQLIHELNAVFNKVSLEVEIAVADLEAAKQEMLGRFEALIATDEEVRYLHDRWRLLPGDDRAVSFVLEELLDAQDRQMEAEAAFVRAQVEYTVSHYNLQRAVGSLLHVDGIPSPHELPGGGHSVLSPTPAPAVPSAQTSPPAWSNAVNSRAIPGSHFHGSPTVLLRR